MSRRMVWLETSKWPDMAFDRGIAPAPHQLDDLGLAGLNIQAPDRVLPDL